MKLWNFFNCCDVNTDIKDQYEAFYENYWQTYGFKLLTPDEYEASQEVEYFGSCGGGDDYYEIASEPWDVGVSDLWYEFNGF